MLFLTQNAVNIRRLELKIDEFSDLVDLGLHLKMSSLRALNVKFSNVSLHQRRSCENALQSFIRGNQNAFPSKRPLRLELDRELDTKFWTNATQYQKDGPESQGGCLEGRLGLYSSLESPCAMDASFIPWFYERFSNSSIDTSRLWWFKDAKDRPVLLEKNGTTKGSAKAVATKTLAFLMQCPQLRELLLCVSHVDQFRLDMLSSHKCQETGDTMEGAKAPRAQLHIPRCPQLSKLNLRTALHTRILLGALNDAVALFRDSLRELGACAGDGYQEYIYEGSGMLPYPTAEFGPNPAVVEFSRRCNTIGYWDAPFLRKIHLMVQGAHYLDVGAFDGCPQLEELYLSSDGRQTTLLAKGSDDKSLDTPPWLDPFKRFPKWTLPRLRALKVVGEIALQFNYGSFIDGMPNLVSAEITDWSPRDPKAKLEDDTWPKRWNLPRLRKLDLVGPMACVFSWGRLLDLPMLKDLNLQYTNPPASRIRKTVIDADSTIPGSITGDDHHQFIWDNKIEGILCKGMPFFKSRLQKIDILGESAMTQDEFVDLMTVYAPNFKDIIVDEISDPEYKMNMSGYLDGITRALNCLDSKNYLELAEKAADMPTTGPEVFYTVEELRGYFLEHAAFGFDEEDLERQKLFSHLSLWPPRTGSRTVRLKLYRSVTDDEARIVDDYCYEISRHEDHSNPPDISVYLHNECLFNLADLE
ncbi:hypothetical protein BGW38_004226 [Lunasporangiospora selenospora]|uniref:Uncharacterized protein n=1 Tax=Lunasporangiospora selenospora TaxID=979761 RepID=A0A9P6KCB0_9FUNG|nr:hypothetical protein BGW38_004226 [Lunasporangiospora selenospora]